MNNDEIIKFDDFLNESLKNINEIKSFITHMEDIIEDIVNNMTSTSDIDLNFSMTIEYNGKSKTLEIPFNSEVYENLEIFLDSVIESDDSYDTYIQSKKFNI